MAQPASEGTLSVKAAAEACHVSLRTVRRWLANDELAGATQRADGVWEIPPPAIVGKLKSDYEDEETDPKKRGTIKAELAQTKKELEIEQLRRIYAERNAEERLRTITILEETNKALQTAINAISE